MSEKEAQTCPKCGTPSKEGDVFCRVCGTRHSGGVSEIKPPQEVKRVCPNCGNALRPAARFCDLCGEECVKVRRERRRGKRKKSECFLIFAAVALLWLAAGVSAIAVYDASKNMSLKKVLTLITDKLSSPDPEDEAAKEEPGREAAAASKDTYESVISYDSLPVAETKTNMPLSESRPGGENEPDATVSADDGSLSDERDEGVGAENMPGAAGAPAVLASPLNVSPESGDETVSVASADERRDSGAWTGQDSEGYSTVAADDRFFTPSQTPSLRGIVTANHVRVRSAPNTSSRIKRQLDSGAEVELVRRFSSGNEGYYWFEVRDSAGSGWIYGEFINPEAGDNKILPVSPDNTGEPDSNPAAETVINTSP